LNPNEKLFKPELFIRVMGAALRLLSLFLILFFSTAVLAVSPQGMHCSIVTEKDLANDWPESVVQTYTTVYAFASDKRLPVTRCILRLMGKPYIL